MAILLFFLSYLLDEKVGWIFYIANGTQKNLENKDCDAYFWFGYLKWRFESPADSGYVEWKPIKSQRGVQREVQWSQNRFMWEHAKVLLYLSKREKKCPHRKKGSRKKLTKTYT